MEYARLEGNHVFGRDTCPFTQRAMGDLKKVGIQFTYHNVERDERVKAEMVARVQPIIGNARVTVPQIWLDGEYVGGSDNLREKLKIGGGDNDSPFCPIG